LITAAYSYGSVDQINLFIETFLKKISFKPYEFITNFSKHKDKKYLKDLSYRFYSAGDLLKLILALNIVLKKYDSLKNLFKNGFDINHENTVIPANFSRVANEFSSENCKSKVLKTILDTRSQTRQTSTYKRMTCFTMDDR
jgi:hypothetical protein